MFASNRPFLENKAVKPILECYYEYGNPSGHAYSSLIIALYLTDKLVLKSNFFERNNSEGDLIEIY